MKKINFYERDDKFLTYNLLPLQIDFIINGKKIEKIIVEESDVTNNLIGKYNYIIISKKDNNGNLSESIFYFISQIEKENSKYIFHISNNNNYNTIYLPSDDFKKYGVQYQLYEKKYKIANLSFGRSGSTIQIYNMKKLGFKYFDYQKTVEDRLNAGFNMLIAVLRDPIGRLESSHRRRLENIGSSQEYHPYYYKYRNLFSHINDYINAIKDKNNSHHQFVMNDLINNKFAVEQTPIVNYYLMNKDSKKKNKIKIIWIDFNNYKKDWKEVLGKYLENITNDANRCISSKDPENKKKSTMSDENKEWINKLNTGIFKQDYELYQKISHKNRNSNYPIITNGAGEIINDYYYLLITLDSCFYKLLKDGTKIDPYFELITPLKNFIEIADKYNIKLSVMFEIFQYEKLCQLDEYNEVIKDINNILLKAHNNGHDIQIHTHCEWIHATFKNGKWYRGGYNNGENADDNFFPIKENIFDDFFGLFDSAVNKLKLLLQGWKPLVWRAGGFRIDEKSKDKLLSLLKERGIKITTNYYTNDTRFKLNNKGYFNNNILPDIPMFKKENRIAQFDYIDIPQNAQYFIDPSNFEKKDISEYVINMPGHIKNTLVSNDKTNEYNPVERKYEYYENFFKRINKNKSFTSIKISDIKYHYKL